MHRQQAHRACARRAEPDSGAAQSSGDPHRRPGRWQARVLLGVSGVRRYRGAATNTGSLVRVCAEHDRHRDHQGLRPTGGGGHRHLRLHQRSAHRLAVDRGAGGPRPPHLASLGADLRRRSHPLSAHAAQLLVLRHGLFLAGLRLHLQGRAMRLHPDRRDEAGRLRSRSSLRQRGRLLQSGRLLRRRGAGGPHRRGQLHLRLSSGSPARHRLERSHLLRRQVSRAQSREQAMGVAAQGGRRSRDPRLGRHRKASPRCRISSSGWRLDSAPSPRRTRPCRTHRRQEQRAPTTASSATSRSRACADPSRRSSRSARGRWRLLRTAICPTEASRRTAYATSRSRSSLPRARCICSWTTRR